MKEVLKKVYPYTDPRDINTFLKIIEKIGVKDSNTLERYLKPSLKHFNHPFSMKDLEKGVDLLISYLDSGKNVMFYGDYDTDGVTSTSLFVKVLNELGYENISWFVPSRLKEGYGISYDRAKEFEKKYDLIVTGDTGIREINSLYNLSIPVIVTDHHDPIVTEEKSIQNKYKGTGKFIKNDKGTMIIPDVDVVINPKRTDCDYNNECLSGVAVVFKLLQGLFIKKGLDQKDLLSHIDLVAVGLVGDLMPQFDIKNQDIEVRLMTALGIHLMNENPSVWLRSIMDINNKEEITFNDIGFFISPRLNAPGRMDNPDISVEFLLQEDPNLNYDLAIEIDEINTERKEFQKQAIESVSEDSLRPDKKIIIAKLDKQFHSGVTGLVASSLSGKYNLPAIVFYENDNDENVKLTGSCRSIEGVHIGNVLEEVETKFKDYVYGGHEQAAGLTIDANDFEDFKNICYDVVSNIDDEVFENHLFYELEIPIDDISFSVVKFIEATFEKFRFYSPKNIFYSPPTTIKNNKEWARLFLEKNKVKYNAVMWSGGESLIQDYVNGLFTEINVVYNLSTWNNRINLNIENYKVVI